VQLHGRRILSAAFLKCLVLNGLGLGKKGRELPADANSDQFQTALIPKSRSARAVVGEEGRKN